MVFFFFFHFFGLHWMKLRNGMLKIMAAFLKRRGKKEEKTQFLWKKEKNWKKKKRPGRDSNPRSSVLQSPLPWQQRYQHTRPTPYHLATEPCTHSTGKIKIFETSTQNARRLLQTLPQSNQPIRQITTRSYSHCILVKLNRCHCAVKMRKPLKHSKTIDSHKWNVLSKDMQHNWT